MNASNIRNLTNFEFLELLSDDDFWHSSIGFTGEIIEAIKARAEQFSRQLVKDADKLESIASDLLENNK